MREEDNTVFVQRYLTRSLGEYVTIDAARPVLDRLAAVTTREIVRILDEQPDHWLPKVTRDAILYWWDSDDRLARVERIRVGIADGTFL
jgi:hypothetical protein